MSDKVTFRVFRGEPDADGDPFGRMVDYEVELDAKVIWEAQDFFYHLRTIF